MSDQPMIEITLDGAPRTIEAGITGALLLQDAVKKDGVVAMRVNGEPWDLERQVPAGAVVEPITLASEDGPRLRELMHSLSEAVRQVGRTGTDAQRQPTARELTDVRRRIYLILAGDEE